MSPSLRWLPLISVAEEHNELAFSPVPARVAYCLASPMDTSPASWGEQGMDRRVPDRSSTTQVFEPEIEVPTGRRVSLRPG
jgi:hypothetical protein